MGRPKEEYADSVAHLWFKEAALSLSAYCDTKAFIDDINTGRGMRPSATRKQIRGKEKTLKKIKIPLFQSVLQAQILVLKGVDR